MFNKLTVQVPAKINIDLWVGEKRADNFHELSTIYQTISLYDQVTLRSADNLELEVTGKLGQKTFPVGSKNIAWQAVTLLANKLGFTPQVKIFINKQIPVAAGMAGGSADAAATLIAANKFFDCNLSSAQLLEIGAELGSDVPFCLTGGTALGSGRGEIITPLLTKRKLHWVVAVSKQQLSTKAVFTALVNLRAKNNLAATPNYFSQTREQVLTWLTHKEASLSELKLHNDLQIAAIDLLPSLRIALQAGLQAGAQQALLSGSGPTCLFLCNTAEEALEVATELSGRNIFSTVKVAESPAGGVQLI